MEDHPLDVSAPEQDYIVEDLSKFFSENSTPQKQLKNTWMTTFGTYEELRLQDYSILDFEWMHMETLIGWVIEESLIDEIDWKPHLVKNVCKAVKSVKPLSKALNDTMDFTKYIDVVVIEDA